MISQTIIYIFKRHRKKGKGGGGNTVKNDAGAMTIVVFTIPDISYLVVGLFNSLVRPLLLLYL